MDQDQPARRGKAQAIVHYFGRLDMFRVVQDQEHCLTSASTGGAIVSALTALFIALLMLQNTYLFWKGEVRSSMFVPSVRVKTEPMEPVHLSVSFPTMPCNLLGVSIVDKHGNALPDLMTTSTVKKTRLSAEDWKVHITPFSEGMSVSADEGCRMDGTIMIDKVPGHFLVGAMGHRGGPRRAGSQHYIHEMWIGNERLNKRRDGIDEDLVNPLRALDHTGERPDTMYKFYLQVVPTYFRNDKGGKVKKLGYQYTASTTKISAPHMPAGLYFSHRHSTLAVEYRFSYQTWSHFIVSLCAIAGGVFTVMSFVSSAVEAIGCTPTAAKVGTFVANYMAGRRRAAGQQHVSPHSPHSPHTPHTPHSPQPLASPAGGGHVRGPAAVATATTVQQTAAGASLSGSQQYAQVPFSPHFMMSSAGASPHTASQSGASVGPNPTPHTPFSPPAPPAMFQPPTFVPPPHKTRTD